MRGTDSVCCTDYFQPAVEQQKSGRQEHDDDPFYIVHRATENMLFFLSLPLFSWKQSERKK
jgi:hypothetical protein